MAAEQPWAVDALRFFLDEECSVPVPVAVSAIASAAGEDGENCGVIEDVEAEGGRRWCNSGLKDSVAERPNHSNLCTSEFR